MELHEKIKAAILPDSGFQGDELEGLYLEDTLSRLSRKTISVPLPA